MQLILIGGAQRSGTTLLQTLLANALDAPVLPEAHILYDILAAYKRAKQFGSKTSFFYATHDDLLSFFRSFAQRHLADIVAKIGSGSALVLKDPNFVQVLDEVAVLFPQSTSVVCLRDPRDIAASFMEIGQRQPTRTKPSKYERRDVGFISKKILASYSPLLTSGQAQNAVMVRYEDVASDPRKALQELARETGLALSLDRIDNPVWLAAEARHEASWITELEGQKPSSARVGSFKRVLRANEIAVVQKICEPILKRFGYSPVEYPSQSRNPLLRYFQSRKSAVS
jgi:hypothetical protein